MTLARKKLAALEFIRENHTLEDTSAAIKDLEKMETAQAEVLATFLQLKTLSEFRSEAVRLCERCKEQEVYLRDMRQVLAHDLSQLQREEDKKNAAAKENKKDLLKEATIFLAVPVGFIASTKNGFGDNRWTVDQAGEVGLIVGSALVMRKPIGSQFKTAFKGAGQFACAVSDRVRYSMTLYYAKETLKENGERVLSATRKAIGLLPKVMQPQ